jgi:hypothetical protein
MSQTKHLKIYLASINMTLTDFSVLMEKNLRYMSRVMNGHVLPGRRLAKEIEDITDGQVKFSSREKKPPV